jgi:hypothetical protein
MDIDEKGLHKRSATFAFHGSSPTMLAGLPMLPQWCCSPLRAASNNYNSTGECV